MPATPPDSPTLAVRGLPSECWHCHLTAEEAVSWPLGILGNMLQVVCPRCFTAVAPVRAVAVEEG